MHAALTVAMCLLAQTNAPANFDFAKGTLAGWDGQGFAIAQAADGRPIGVWSADDVAVNRKGMIRIAFRVPMDARQITFQSYADVKGDNEPDQNLNVILAGPDNVPAPRQVKASNGTWSASPRILLPWLGKPRTYAWDVTLHQGKLLQIVLIDQDERPGHFLWAGDFKLISAGKANGLANATGGDLLDADFGPFMLGLKEKNRLAAMNRYDSKRFTAISNASDKFTTERLQNCEVFYDLFLKHFKSKGFTVFAPPQRMMIAIFDTHEGFDAYFGERMPSGVAGVYHTATNRLVLYDYAENRGLIAYKESSLKKGDSIVNPLAKDRYAETVERKLNDLSKDANLSTTMHECAHQISFNCGLLHRNRDVPASIAEGLATYCESTDEGDWTMLGAENPMRIGTLRQARGKYIPLSELLRSEQWRQTQHVLWGYGQSWALFHYLMHRQPAELQKYFKLIEARRTPESRLADFQEAFGDLRQFETRYQAYMNEMVARTAPTKAR
ncbi:MAG: DUF1570 domain-containing protein [Planctomycetota bacterium]